MQQFIEQDLTELTKQMERVADALEQANRETLDVVNKTIHTEENKEENKEAQEGQFLPEEQFIKKVRQLNHAFQEVVDSFAEGEAQRVNYMQKYPFASFSVVQLAVAVNEWNDSLRIVDKVKEDKKKRDMETQKRGLD